MSAQDLKTVLLVEDSESQAQAYCGYLAQDALHVEHVESGEAALDYLAGNLPDVILLDLNLPGMHGMEVLNDVVARELPAPVIVITEDGPVDVAVDAMRNGAFDFLSKPFGGKRLRVTVQNAIRQEELAEQVAIYKEQYERDHFHGFIGASRVMQAVYRTVESVAPSKASVFITGESGTGKELCAEAIHQESPRRDKPFVPVNCAAIPRELMESEIFGHVKGAFTGAVKDREGAARQADGGTLFLDEICEMDADLQSKLLRFVQTGTLQSVGANAPTTVDVRFVCATNRDPLDEVRKGNFREDLYYRLHVIPLALPPLREREGDILAIARWILSNVAAEEGKAFTGFASDTEAVLEEYQWPGNVRELQNVIRQIVVLNPGGEVTTRMLPDSFLSDSEVTELASAPALVHRAREKEAAPDQPDVESEPASNEIRPMWEVERETIEKAIDLCQGNVPKAAALLGISTSTIYRKKQAWSSRDQ
jgi:two-component system repressor protein LuxO